MVHVFLITAHRDPKMLHRLLVAIEADNHYAFVNIDCKSGHHKPFIPIGNNRNVVFLDGKDRICRKVDSVKSASLLNELDKRFFA